RLLRLSAALGVEKIEREPVFLEYAAALTELGDRCRPVAPLSDRELQLILRVRGGRKHQAGRCGEHAPQRAVHAFLRRVIASRKDSSCKRCENAFLCGSPRNGE